MEQAERNAYVDEIGKYNVLIILSRSFRKEPREYAGQEDEYVFYFCDKIAMVRKITLKERFNICRSRKRQSEWCNPWGYVDGDFSMSRGPFLDRPKGIAIYFEANLCYYIGDGS